MPMKSFDLSHLSALIVEKHQPMRALFREMLRELGFQRIYDAVTPDLGFEKFNEKEPDIVLIDWAPDFDGIGLLKKIRRDAKSYNFAVPVIMVTAHSEVDHVIETRDASSSTPPGRGKRRGHRRAACRSCLRRRRWHEREAQIFQPARRPRRPGPSHPVWSRSGPTHRRLL